MIKSISIKGFKSFRALKEMELGAINVIVGANGTGKSNFIEVFRIISAMLKNGGLREYVAGASDVFLFGGPQITSHIQVRIVLDTSSYEFELIPTDEGFLMLTDEKVCPIGDTTPRQLTGRGFASALPGKTDSETIRQTYEAIKNCQVYHFHDTGKFAAVRRYCQVSHDTYLNSDGGNLAAFLYKLRQRHPNCYGDICQTVKSAVPFFDDFILEPNGNEDIRLCWRQKGLVDFPMRPHQLSDGALRFICLATALLQPNPPSTIIIDEPELGLHPEAIYLLAEMMISVSRRTQLVIATQSPQLLDNFAIDDIIVAKRHQGATSFERLRENDYDAWLEDFSVGELWTHDIIHGGTVHE
ncbi:MAG: AAA family ATPase [Victivallales bacterium]|nr:AAA family ATPase [Victivallales bacterium]